MAINPLVQINIELERIGEKEVKIININGRLTISNSGEISNKLKNIFDDGNFYAILMLGNVQYLDSKGMAMLLTLEKTVKDNNGMLLLTKPIEFVQELFNLTNLDTYFTFVKDLDEGRKYFSSL